MTIAEASDFLLKQVQTNQFLTGATITGAIAGVVYFLRDKLVRLYRTINRFFQVSITIHSEDPLYIPISSWLYANNFDRFAKNYRIRYIDGKTAFGPSDGTFLFWHKRRLLRVTITREQGPQSASWRAQTREYMSISYYSITRSNNVIHSIIDESKARYHQSEEGIPVYVCASSCWSLVTRIARRNVSSVVLAGDTLQRIEADVLNFLNRSEWYFERGVPYHRGYLFTGPPGTGKTSLVRHLAQRFGLPIYVSDGSMKSISSVPPDSILLLEDVESIAKIRNSAQALAGQVNLPVLQSAAPQSESLESLFAPTLSELLNALDGVASTEKVLIIMTTNHPELLDQAAVRPGRVDYTLHLGRCTVEQAVRMFVKFYGPLNVLEFESVIEDQAYTPAQLQELFIACETPLEAVEAVRHSGKQHSTISLIGKGKSWKR